MLVEDWWGKDWCVQKSVFSKNICINLLSSLLFSINVVSVNLHELNALMLWSGFSWFLWFGLSASLCINSYVCQCKIDLLLGEIDWARGKQVGEKFNLVSFDEYCIVVYGLKQTSFNLIRLIQVHRVGCGCFLFCSFRDTQSSMCQIISKLRATVLGKKKVFFSLVFQTFHGYLAFIFFSFAFCVKYCFHPWFLGNFLFLYRYTEIKIYS